MLSHIMLSGPMTSRRRMPMASSWKLKTTLRRKKSLGSMPSPAFARAGPPPSRGQALEPVNRFAVALAVGVVHGGEQVGRPGQLELVVAPVFEWILGDHRTRQAQAGGALESARCCPS